MITIDTLNTYPLSKLCGIEVACGCGEKHAVATKDIAVGAGALDTLPKMLETLIAPLIKVYIVTDKTCFNLAGQAVERLLNSRGFKTERYIYEDGYTENVQNADKLLDLPEDAKAFVAVGGGRIFDMVKYEAVKLKLPVFGVMTSLSSDAYLAPFSMLYNKGFKEIYVTKAPLALVADINIMAGGGEALTAAGYGLILSKKLAVMDWRFSHRVTGEKYCPYIAEQALAAVAETEKLSEGLLQNERAAIGALTENLLRLSLMTQLLKSSRLSNGGETHLCHAVEGILAASERPERLYGENLFLSAIFLAKVYCAFLRDDMTDFVPPPDLNMRAEKMAEIFHAEEGAALKRIRPYMAAEAYAVTGHKFKEYRPDFFSEAQKAEAGLSAGLKIFKRLYSDAGFWMKSYLTEQDYRQALGIAPDLREKYTVLTYMRDLGLLDKYLSE